MAATVPCINPAHGVKHHISGTAAAVIVQGVSDGDAEPWVELTYALKKWR